MKTNDLAVCIIGGGLLFVSIGIALIPNSPKITRQPLMTEVESDDRIVALTETSVIRRSLGLFEVTAYCPCERCCGRFADGITASLHRIEVGDRFCAADPGIPFGKWLDIPGYGYVPVWDRGGKIKGNKLDVFFSTHEEALEWGRQELEIFCWVEGE